MVRRSTDLTARTRAFLSQVETVEDAARKADVLPARVREVLDRAQAALTA